MARVAVNPENLQWAVQRAGLSVDVLRKKFPKVSDWLQGELAPTLKQLEDFSRMTHTPIGFLFLPEPPDISLPIPDFRTMAAERLISPSPDLLETIYLCQQRQDWYRDYTHLYAEDELAWVSSGTIEADVIKVAAELRGIVGFDLAERQRLATWSDALRFFIEKVEKSGVLVMISGIVGSNTHRKLSPEEFRGFALVDSRAPIIFINGADSKSAQMFTLAHELSHLWLGETGVSDSQVVRWPEKGVEYWCNAVAAELLVPLEVIQQAYRPEETLEDEIQRLTRQFKVSSLVALRRIFDLGAIDSETLWQAYNDELERLRQLNKVGAGGGDFYRTLGSRVSKRFVRAVIGSTLEGQTLFRDAFRLLGIRKTETFYRAANEFGGR